MDEIQHLKNLDARANAGPVPIPGAIDVTAAVLDAIATRPLATTDNRMLWGMAAAAVVVAAVSLSLAWQDLSGVSDPLHGLFGHFAMVMQ